MNQILNAVGWLILKMLFRSSMYTIIWNTMAYPALVIPVTTVDPAIDVKPDRDSFWSEDDEVIHNICE